MSQTIIIIKYIALVRGELFLSSGVYWKVHEYRKQAFNKEVNKKTLIIYSQELYFCQGAAKTEQPECINNT